MTPEPTFEERMAQLTPPKITRQFLSVKRYRKRILGRLNSIRQGYAKEVKRQRKMKMAGVSEKLQWQVWAVDNCIKHLTPISLMWNERLK